MNAAQIELVQKTWALVKPNSEEVAVLFYQTLFDLDPKLKPLFKSNIKAQGKKLMLMLDSAVSLLNNLDELVPVAQELAIRHLGYGVKKSHYKTVGSALIKTLEIGLAAKFTEPVRQAWTEVYGVLANTMIAAAESHEKTSGKAIVSKPIKSKLVGKEEKSDMNNKSKSSDNLAVQLKGALDQSATAIMMIDRDFRITYFNDSTLKLLNLHKDTFKKKWPNFNPAPEHLMGFCIDAFHENPHHQRSLLANHNNLPYKTDINIEHLTIELNVSAIFDAENNYIGNSLEWSDVTDARYQRNRATQLQGAIDSSGTAMIMINRDFEITYFNDASIKLLKKHEERFRRRWPKFDASAEHLMGFCIDNFHKNPSHQRRLLSDPSVLPYTTDIEIEGVKIQLNVTGIFDSKDKYIGNSLEWRDVTSLRNAEIEIGRLKSAVNGMTTNLMMADLDGNIVYLNPAVTTMLKRREQQLRTVLPSFNVATLVGSNIDSFHQNPSHQRNLLGNVDNLPYTAQIKVAGLEFQLIAIPLKDSEGVHIGNAVQWLDITDQNDAQRQIEAMIKSAISGDLEQRIDTQNYDGFIKNLGNSINNLMNTIIEPLNAAISVAQSLAEGDLSNEMNGEYSGTFLDLANAMNSSIANLNSLVTEIRVASTNVFESAREIAQGNSDLSQRTESQASSLEETASAMEQLASTVQQNAENAEQASKLSRSVMEKASNGGKVVENAISAMSEINKSSKEIADIISVIDEIAFQTNLLALNAAVEAARAGEQGRGFAVVAAEVRNLAQRSAGAAKEIKGLINYSVEAVGKGTKLVDETGQTFEQLVKSIDEMGVMIADIDSAGKEQSAGIGEVSSAVTQMDEMTQQNAALVEEAAASSKSMEEQAQTLLQQISFFKNNEPETNIRKQPLLKSNSATKKLNQPQPTRKTMPSAPATDSEWEEF